MASKIENVLVGDVDPNPFRLLGEYPYSEKKLRALERSIKDVGLWEGIIGRRRGNRVQIAFGHHRYKAAMNFGLAKIPVVVRDLTDEEMLQFMGRENLEDFNADFLVMLETWEAGVNFPDASGKKRQAIDVAKLLGWTTIHSSSNAEQLNDTARACFAAFSLVKAGHVDRADLSGLGVKAAQTIVERAHTRVEQIKKWGQHNKVDAKVIKQQESHVADAAKSVAKQVRDGKLGHKDARARVDMEAFSRQIKQDKALPKFPAFGNALGDQIQKMLASDSVHEKLVEIEDVLHAATDPNDVRVIGRLVFELEHLVKRADKHINKLDLTKAKAKVTQLRALPSE